MSYRICSLFVLFLLFACGNSSQKEAFISGRIEGGQGQWLYFEKLLPESSKTLDSCQIDGEGKFAIQKAAEDMTFYRLRLGPEKRSTNFGAPDNILILLTDSTESIRVDLNAARFYDPTHLEGSRESLLFGEVQKMAESANTRLDSMRRSLRTSPNYSQEEAQTRFVAFQESIQLEIVAWIEAHQGAFATLQALSILDPNQNVALLDTTSKILSANYPENPFVARLSENVAKLSQAAVGTKAPLFSIPDPEGNPIGLEDVLGKGKLILLDFWASWCRPCRQENPNLVKTYQRFKSKGLEVFSVSLDREKDPWLAAIKEDGLTWYHGSDLGFWNAEPARLYNVNTIPHNFLLDQNGTILYRNIHGEQLNQILADLLE